MSLIETLLSGRAGETVRVEHPWFLVNDASFPQVEKDVSFTTENADRTVLCIDHIVPSNSEEIDAIQVRMRDAARKSGCRFYEGKGIGYILLQDLLKAGDVICGLGAHMGTLGACGAVPVKCTAEVFVEACRADALQVKVPETLRIRFAGEKTADTELRDVLCRMLPEILDRKPAGKALELCGEGLAKLSREEVTGLCAVLSGTGAWTVLVNREDTGEEADVTVCLAEGEQVISYPGDPLSSTPLSERENIPVHSVFIGGCTDGGIVQIRKVVALLGGRHTKPFVRTLVTPQSMECYLKAVDEGLIKELVEVGVMVSNPHCSTCGGKTQNVIAANEVLVSTGICPCREGLPEGTVCFASVKTAVEAAVSGYLKGGAAE